MGCWYRHGLMTSDPVNTYLNGFNLIVYAFYIFAFAYYQPKRKYLFGQVISLFLAFWTIFNYVESETDPSKKPDLMSGIAAGTQILSLFGGVYEIVSFLN